MFKAGQKVWCVMFGEGVVTNISTSNACYPVVVSFGGKVEDYTSDGKYRTDAAQTLFPCPVEIVKEVTKPSIDWEHVSSEFNYLAEDSEGGAFLFEKEPFVAGNMWGAYEGETAEAHMLASYVKGTCDWKESLIQRPAGDSHDN
jgi:hypothetical protein